MAILYRTLEKIKLHRIIGLVDSKSSLLRHLSAVKIVPTACKTGPDKHISHDEYNMKLKRPLSPHLTIYAVQLTSTCSITHRMTGIVLSAYVALLGFQSIFAPCDLEYYIEELECLEIGKFPVMFIKFIFAFPFCYHYCNGVRHLLWDTGMFLTMKTVYITGYIMLLAAFGGTAFLCTM